MFLDEAELAIEISQEGDRNAANPATWSAVSGYSNLKKIDLSTLTGSIIVDSVVRKITRFNVGHVQGRKKYKQANSRTEAQQTEKMWFQSGTVLYAHFQSGVDPNAAGFLAFAFILWPHADRPKHFNRQYYEPRVAFDSSGYTHQIAIEDKFYSMRIDNGGSVSWNNADGIYDKLLALYEWLGCKHRLLSGVDTSTSEMDYSDYSTEKNSTINDVTRTDTTVVFDFGTDKTRTDVPFHRLHYDDSTDADDDPLMVAYSNAPDDSLGEEQPHMMGDTNSPTANNVKDFNRATRLTLVDQGDQPKGTTGWINQKYKIAGRFTDHETDTNHGIKSIDKILIKNGTAIKVVASKYWSTSEGGTLITFIKKYVINQGDEVRALFQGIPDASGKFTGVGASSIKKAYHMLRFIYTVICRYTSDELYIPSFLAIGESWTDPDGTTWNGELDPPAWDDDCRFRWDQPMTAQDCIDMLCRGIRGTIQENTDGQIELKLLDATGTKDDTFLSDEDYEYLKEKLSLTDVVPYVVVHYKHNPARGVWRKVRSHNTSYVGALIGREKSGKTKKVGRQLRKDGGSHVEHIQTALTTRSQAKLLANEYAVNWDRPRVEAELKEILGKAMRLRQGDNIVLRRIRAIGGPMNRKVFWIEKLGANVSAFWSDVTSKEARKSA